MSQPHPSWLVGGVFPKGSIGTLSYVRILDTVDMVLLVSGSTDWPALALDGIAEITDVVARINRSTTFFEVAMEWAATVGALTDDTFRAGWFRW